MQTNTVLSSEKLFTIPSPTGENIEIPVSYDPPSDIYTKLTEKDQIKQFYTDNGYVIQRNLIPAELCNAATRAFREDIKTSPGYFYRQGAGLAEKHRFNDNHFMLNAVMNIQDVDRTLCASFRDAALKILTHTNIRSVLDILIKGEAIVAQTMFFEGNPVTWPHQDKEYLDSNEPGTMVAAWVAVEDIQPGAGRFYVYPKSHFIDIEKLGGNLNILLDKDAYVTLVIHAIRKYQLECVAPALKKGDVLFWHGKTIHGSLATTQPDFSRSSFTAHYMPLSKALLQLQVRQKKLKLREVNGMKINFPKDQRVLANKLIFLAETTFPTLFKKLKAAAIRLNRAQ